MKNTRLFSLLVRILPITGIWLCLHISAAAAENRQSLLKKFDTMGQMIDQYISVAPGNWNGNIWDVVDPTKNSGTPLSVKKGKRPKGDADCRVHSAVVLNTPAQVNRLHLYGPAGMLTLKKGASLSAQHGYYGYRQNGSGGIEVQDGACLKIEKFFYLSGLTQIDNGTGSFLQSGGTVSANCTLYLAGPSPATSSAQSTGVYTLAGGVLVINAPEGQEGIANGIGKGAFHFGKGTLVTNALAIDLENVNGGNFSPAGDEITGTTHLTGKKPRTYRQGAGGKMTITLASKNDHDRLMWNTQNGSSVVIEKGAVFEIVFLRNYRPKSGDVFTIITADRIELKGDPVIRVEGRPFKAQVLKETPQALQLVCQ